MATQKLPRGHPGSRPPVQIWGTSAWAGGWSCGLVAGAAGSCGMFCLKGFLLNVNCMTTNDLKKNIKNVVISKHWGERVLESYLVK